jgi:hypothetical protein
MSLSASPACDCADNQRGEIPLNRKIIALIGVALGSGMALAQQDKFTLQVPNGLAFSDFRGYENWQDVAVSQTKVC